MIIQYKDWNLVIDFDYEKADPSVGLSAQIYINNIQVEDEEANETLSDLMYDRYQNDPIFRNFLDEAMWTKNS